MLEQSEARSWTKHKSLWVTLALILGVAALALMLTTGGTRAHVGETFTVDQQQLDGSNVFGSKLFAQSFTVGITGDLAKISVGLGGNPGKLHTGTLNIYSGGITPGPGPISGDPGTIDGPLLHSQTVTWTDAGTASVLTPFKLTTHIAVTVGRELTWELVHADPGQTVAQSVFGGRALFAYADGRYLADSVFDHHFETFIAASVPETSDKVDVCHKGKKTINISSDSLDDHLAHGDTKGSC